MTQRLDQAMVELPRICDKVDSLQTSIQEFDSHLEMLITYILPSITIHIASITTALAMHQLELEVYQRKWAIIINDIVGTGKEREDDAQAACETLVNDILNVPNAGTTHVKALPQAGGRVSWIALSQRSQLLSNAKNLKGKHISISPDPLLYYKHFNKTFWQKQKLPPTQRKPSNIRYQKRWPFLKLAIKCQQDLYPRISQTVNVEDLLGTSPNTAAATGHLNEILKPSMIF